MFGRELQLQCSIVTNKLLNETPKIISWLLRVAVVETEIKQIVSQAELLTYVQLMGWIPSYH